MIFVTRYNFVLFKYAAPQNIKNKKPNKKELLDNRVIVEIILFSCSLTYKVLVDRSKIGWLCRLIVANRAIIDPCQLINSHALIQCDGVYWYVGDTLENVPVLVQIVVLKDEVGEHGHGYDEEEACQHAECPEWELLFASFCDVARELYNGVEAKHGFTGS